MKIWCSQCIHIVKCQCYLCAFNARSEATWSYYNSIKITSKMRKLWNCVVYYWFILHACLLHFRFLCWLFEKCLFSLLLIRTEHKFKYLQHDKLVHIECERAICTMIWWIELFWIYKHWAHTQYQFEIIVRCMLQIKS